MDNVVAISDPVRGNAVRCVRCIRKGHICYASHIVDGEGVCIYCLDNEPCFYEQRQATKAEPAKESPMPQVSSAPKTNGHVEAAAKSCPGYKRECGKPLKPRNTSGLCTLCYARRSYAKSHPKAVRGVRRPKAAHAENGRVSLEVTEAQLNQFLVRLSLEDKQRLANYFLQSVQD